MKIPTIPDEITAVWLTEALQAGGMIGAETATLASSALRVSAIKMTRIGEDESFAGGALLRLHVAYDVANLAAPHSFIAKMTPADPDMRATMKSLNAREARFYINLARQQEGLPLLRCYYGDFDQDSGQGILLLEDLGTYRAVALVEGCRLEEAQHTINALAQIHAHWWNSLDLALLDGIGLLQELPFSGFWEQYRQKVAEVLPAFPIPDAFFALGDYVAEHEFAIGAYMFEQAPQTCIHRDGHVDNILFGRRAEHKTAVILDWQLVGKGRGIYDVAYFLIGSVPTGLRRQVEKKLVRSYHEQLVRAGIEGYGFEQCWLDYRLAAFGKLFVSVAATVNVDNSTPFKKAWRQADLERLLAFCDDHNVLELLRGLDLG